MSQNNTITPVTNDPDHGYDNDFPYIEHDFLVNMMANIMLDLENQNPNSYLENTLHQSLNDKNPVKCVIVEEVRKNLLTIKYKDILEKNNNDKCIITQEFFDDNSDVIQLPCSHCFNSDAIINWLTKEKGECPVCRFKFECVELKDEDSSAPEQNNNNLSNNFFILPSYLVNEPQTRVNGEAYFDFLRMNLENDGYIP